MYRLTHCLERYSPGVGDVASDRRGSEYTVPPPRTDVIHTVPFTVCCSVTIRVLSLRLTAF